jgi:hypothetical protein
MNCAQTLVSARISNNSSQSGILTCESQRFAAHSMHCLQNISAARADFEEPQQNLARKNTGKILDHASSSRKVNILNRILNKIRDNFNSFVSTSFLHQGGRLKLYKFSATQKTKGKSCCETFDFKHSVRAHSHVWREWMVAAYRHIIHESCLGSLGNLRRQSV